MISIHFPCSTCFFFAYFKDFPSDFRCFCVDETLDVIDVGHSPTCKPGETDGQSLLGFAGLEAEIHDMETTARCKSLSHGLEAI